MAATLHRETESAVQAFSRLDSRSTSRSLLRWFAILLFVWSISGIYEGYHLKRGWVPWDAGAYAQSAARVLHGQLPHRDFIDVYTGGLSYLNAGAMRLFGETLAAERFVLFIFFMAWVPVLYWIASRFCPDWVAGGVALLAMVWSVPNYSEAVPSWYNLFFASFGVAALLAYLKRPAWKWLLLAGICGGLSFLAKSVGLCYAGAVLLFFVFREQRMNAEDATISVASSRFPSRKLGWRGYTVFVCACLLIFLVLLIRLISPLALLGADAAADEFVLFLLPAASLCAVLVAGEMKICNPPGSLRRLASLFRMCIPFGIGVVLPISIFFVPYIRAHAAGMLLHDLFTQASTRIAAAYKLPDVFATVLPAAFLVAMVAASVVFRKLTRLILLACVTGFLIWAVATAFTMYQGYVAIWSAAYWLPPILVAVGSGLFLRSPRPGAPGNLQEGQPLFLLLSVTALCALVEFPYSAPVYFCYVAPLAILCVAALVRPFPRVSRAMLAVIYAGFLVFVVFAVTPDFIYAMGFGYRPDKQSTRIELPRAGGLRADTRSATIYEKLIPLIRAHAGSGNIYAAGDCPEVYFLSGHRNLTPDIYDFLDPQAGQPQRVLAFIDDPQINVVVLNNKPALTSPLPKELREAIAQRFPLSETVGNFEVHWRNK
jgi:hypothetical protein